MDEVFIDASFWIAIIYAPDSHHEEARRSWTFILERDWNATTTNWTLYEAATVLNGRRLRRHYLALELLTLANRTTHIVDASGLESEAVAIFRSHSDKRWSVVDCANFACLSERQSRWALSFDGDFAQAQSEFGFKLLGAGASA